MKLKKTIIVVDYLNCKMNRLLRHKLTEIKNNKDNKDLELILCDFLNEMIDIHIESCELIKAIERHLDEIDKVDSKTEKEDTN